MRKVYQKAVVMAAGISVCMAAAGSVHAGSSNTNPGSIETIIKEQQQQLDSQASEIAALKEQLRTLLGNTEANKEVLATKVDREEIDKLKTEKMVSSSKSGVKVSVYGQVNRAVLFADNGDSGKAYFVDNSNSSTRMGIKASAKATDDMSIGSKIEYELVSNPSSGINQFDQSMDAEINLRKAEVWLKSNAGGTLSIGQGSTASDGTSEMDLSGTSVVAASNVGDMAGGQYWNIPNTSWYTVDEEGNEEFHGSVVGKSYSNMDGLSRRDRVRYDTPSFAGFSFAASVMEDEGYDMAARFQRKFGDSKIATAIAWAKSGSLKSWDDQINGSVSFLHSSGFNATMAAARQTYDIQGKDDPMYWYGKLGYKAKLFAPGETAFSIDYGTWNDLAKNGDEATSVGFAFVQNVKDWGTEFYLGYRLYSMDRVNTSFDDVNSVMLGARLKF